MARPGAEISFKEVSKFNWDDIQPVKQYDGNPPILNLKYAPKYEELMDYFRGILHTGEISERAHEIAGFVVQLICSNYNAWYLRKLCVEQLETLTYQSELEFADELREGNEKVFQYWDHRKYLVEKLNDPSKEIEFLEDAFEQDSKNYHGWSYRIWLCQKFDMYEKEWEKIQKYFEDDIRNNSAWNYRFFLFSHKFYNPETKNIQSELQFTLDAIQKDPLNESSWNYLSGFFTNYEFKQFSQQFDNQQKSSENTFSKPVSSHQFHEFPEIQKFAEELFKTQQNNRLLLNILVEININLIVSNKVEDKSKYIKQALEYTHVLANEVDSIRCNYWNWVTQNLKQDFQELLQEQN